MEASKKLGVPIASLIIIKCVSNKKARLGQALKNGCELRV